MAAAMFGLRLCVNSNASFFRPMLATGFVRHIHTAQTPLLFGLSEPLCREPLKKKKGVDATVVMMRLRKKRTKMEREIKFLKRYSNRLKPVVEIEPELSVVRSMPQRKRKVGPVSAEELERRVLLEKKWCAYKVTQAQEARVKMESLLAEQERALRELKIVSEELYEQAIQVDPVLLPFKCSGPRVTPPSPDFPLQDGEYNDVTRTYMETGKGPHTTELSS